MYVHLTQIKLLLLICSTHVTFVVYDINIIKCRLSSEKFWLSLTTYRRVKQNHERQDELQKKVVFFKTFWELTFWGEPSLSCIGRATVALFAALVVSLILRPACTSLSMKLLCSCGIDMSVTC